MISGAAAVVCVVLAVVPRRRRRDRLGGLAVTPESGPSVDQPESAVPSHRCLLGADRDDRRSVRPGPVLASPLTFPRSSRPPLWIVGLTAVAAGLISAAFVHPVVAVGRSGRGPGRRPRHARALDAARTHAVGGRPRRRRGAVRDPRAGPAPLPGRRRVARPVRAGGASRWLSARRCLLLGADAARGPSDGRSMT